MTHRSKMTLTAALMCMLAACASENPGPSSFDDAGLGLDTAADTTDDTANGDTSRRDTDPGDVDPGDTHSGGDVGPDAEPDGGADPGRTIADYRRCSSDSECPVGLGSCVKQVTLNRPDANGVETVPIGDIFEQLDDGQGICTEICTESADACKPLSVNGTTDDPVEHACQVVVVGEAPYPDSAPSFAFADQLDPAEQAKGQAFGAICRPPFELDDDINSSLCSQCQGADDCAQSGSLCWSTFANAPVAEGDTGICLSACSDQGDCPLGFSCDAQISDDQSGDAQRYCRPTLDTCTDCQDVDGDGFGTGRCGSQNQPITPHDCDDRNADAYFDPANMEHAFPTYCGQQDFNCNGLSDEDEQVGADAFPADHCTACFDTCDGAVDHGQRACQSTGADSAGQPACAAKCAVDANGDPTHADCDGDIANGCEVPIDDASRLYYRDADGDGYGDPSDLEFACDPSQAPSGYVSNSDDCNDTSATTWGGSSPADEVCDGIDNDCDADVDEEIAQQDTSCSTGADGVCDPGTWQCQGSAGFECIGNILPDTQTESCDGVDNDCDGETDEDGADGATAYYIDADGDDHGDETASPRFACSKPAGYVTDNSDCNDSNSSQHPATAELCSTSFDDDCDGDTNEDTATDASTWYSDSDSDTFGNSNDSTVACAKPSGYVSRTGDCNDGNQQVNPDADEVCNNGTDDDCDGNTDDATAVDATEYYRDRDGDNFGDAAQTTLACSVPSGYTVDDTDCNDDPTNRGSSANPGQIEVCDGVNNDCDGDIDIDDGDVDEGCPRYYADRTGSVATRNRMGYNSSDSKTTTCNADRVWTRASVAYYPNDWPVQEIDVGCQDIVIHEDRSSATYDYSVGTDNGPYWHDGAGFGDGGSTRGTFQCGAGEAIYKVSIDYDSLIQQVTFHCRKYKLNGSGTSATLASGTETTVTSYGPDGGTDYSAKCGYNQVAVGAKIYNGFYSRYNTLYGIELKCQTLKVDKK